MDKKNDFQVKLRAVLFVLYFEENVLQEKFEELFDTLYEITLIRNTFHRGPNGFTSYQQNIINRIYQNPSSHYHKFFGTLCDFLVKSLNSKSFFFILLFRQRLQLCFYVLKVNDTNYKI